MAGDIENAHILYCSFCGKSQHEVRKLVAGPDVFICDECLELCGDIVREETKPDDRGSDRDGGTPVTIAGPGPREKHAVVLCPLVEPFDTIYRDHIGPAVKAAGFTLERADEIFVAQPTIEDLWKATSSAEVVIADVTGRDPSVMYQLGMAHTVGRPTLIITQNLDDVPFDVKVDRCVIYERTPRGCVDLERKIRTTLRFLRP